MVRLGAVFPQREIGNDPAVIRHWAQAVEEFGFAHVMVYDHVVGAGTRTRPGWRGYTSEDAFHEVFVLLGYLAAVTSSVELVTGVLILPQRQTALVAKQAAEVDLLSAGRLRLGVGVGWNPVEYEVLGEDFTTRGARSAEQIRLLRELWANPLIDFDGEWHTVHDAGLNPLPARSIPIWVGGTAEAVLRRVGELGDGWFPQRPPDEKAAALIARIHEHAERAGREVSGLGIEATLDLYDCPEQERAAFAAGWADLGATHLCINTMQLGLRDVDAHLEMLSRTRDLLASG